MAGPDQPRPNRFAVGCFLAPASFFGGGIIAVLVSKAVDRFSGCRAPEGVPSCNWLEFFLVGGLIGLILLPGAVVWRLRQESVAPRNSERS
jgi:hypothetical protein